MLTNPITDHKFPEMIPDFINKEFIEKVWKQYFKDEDVTVEECDIELVGAKGDNYSSVMCRAKSKIRQAGQLIEKRMVIKTMPTTEGAIKYVTESLAFEKEIQMLGEIIPLIEQTLKTVGISTKLAANLYYSELTPNRIIAMEDLGVAGYSIRNRHNGLDFQECVTVAKSLAELHAASIVILKNYPKIKEAFRDSIWSSNNREDTRAGLEGCLKTIIKGIDEFTNEKWAEKLQKIQNITPDAFYAATEARTPVGPMVLNHGDCWVNNMMFESPTNLRFVDLQLSWINSPVFDLQYFMFTSMNPSIRFTKMDEFLKAYHERFTVICELLKLDIEYSYQDLQDDLLHNLIFGFTCFYFIHAVILAPSEDAVDTSRFDDDLWIDNPIYKNRKFWENFAAGLPFFESKGFFPR